MKYYKSELWKQHPDSRNLRITYVIWYAIVFIGVGVAGRLIYILDFEPPENDSEALLVLLGALFSGMLAIAAGIQVKELHFPILAKRRIERLARALGDKSPEEVATWSLRAVQELGNLILTDAARRIAKLEEHHSDTKLMPMPQDMRELLKWAVTMSKDGQRKHMEYVYNELLPFGVVPKGGIDVFFLKPR